MKTTNRYRNLLTISIILFIWCAPFVVHAQLFDGNREGLILGGGVGYGIVASGDYGSVSGFTTSGKIGYGFSDQFAIYAASDVSIFFPHLVMAYFLDPTSDYFLQGALGYTSIDDDSILSLGGGLGYELRDHLSIELMFGYNRVSETYISSWNFYTGRTTTSTSHSNIITVAATFNYYFY